MKILVCGQRDFQNKKFLYENLDDLNKELRSNLGEGITKVIQGGAKGADLLGKQWARDRNILCSEFPADWNKHGKSAGPIRNNQMLKEGRPHFVVAFYHDKQSSKGTKNMVFQAKQAGVPVIEYTTDSALGVTWLDLARDFTRPAIK
jgi:hypothetical protein